MALMVVIMFNDIRKALRGGMVWIQESTDRKPCDRWWESGFDTVDDKYKDGGCSGNRGTDQTSDCGRL